MSGSFGKTVAVEKPRRWLPRGRTADRIGARIIAWYAAVQKSWPVCLAPQSQHLLRALVTRLRQFTDLRTARLTQQRLRAAEKLRA